jgi:catechol 2,3-dioxygenase-like lactoylglutathione lyase family enzyme
VPELLVTDLGVSLAFWRGLLGFVVVYDRPQEGFAFLNLDGAEVMLERRSDAMRQWLTGRLAVPFGRGVNFPVEVPSLDAISNRLREASWPPLFMDLEEKWYVTGAVETGQRQLSVQDPDGYLVRLVETIGQRPLGAAAK